MKDKKLRIVGGPLPHDVRIYYEDTDISSYVTKIDIRVRTDELVSAIVEFVNVDVDLESILESDRLKIRS